MWTNFRLMWIMWISHINSKTVHIRHITRLFVFKGYSSIKLSNNQEDILLCHFRFMILCYKNLN